MADVFTRIGLIKGPQGGTGATGPTGPQGNAATISVGTVSTTAYGNPAQVVNVGDEHDAIFNIVIPQGAPGATVTQMDNLALNTITAATDEYPQIQIGDTGRTIFGKIVKFFQDLVSKLALKVNYTDSLTLEEIAASSDLTNKVASAEAAESLRESLANIGQYRQSLSNYSGSVAASAHISDTALTLTAGRWIIFASGTLIDSGSNRVPLAIGRNTGEEVRAMTPIYLVNLTSTVTFYAWNTQSSAMNATKIFLTAFRIA